VSADSVVCPRCGTDAESHRFCPTCGLNLPEQRELPTRAVWERRIAEMPWPQTAEQQTAQPQTAQPQTAQPQTAQPQTARGGPPTRASGVRARWEAQPAWLRSLLVVGLPLVAIAATAVIVFTSQGSRHVAGALRYDSRAQPLLSSLMAARQQQLQSGSCRQCAAVQTSAGGCSGFGPDWACDVHVNQSRRDPKLVKGSNLIETYKVKWQSNGCWQAQADCVSEAGRAGRLCPPPTPVALSGCIRA
jgi:hypothetical protein